MNLTSITSRQNNSPTIACYCYFGLVDTWFCWVKKKKKKERKRPSQWTGGTAEQATEWPRHATQSGVPCRLVFPPPREVAEHPTQHACLPSRSSLPSPSSSSPPSPSSSSSSEEPAPAAGPQFGRDPSIRFDLPRVWLVRNPNLT
jgi:hypothetical protein